MAASDTFTGSDTTVISSRTSDSGHNWTRHSSSPAANLTIVSNTCRDATGNNPYYYIDWTPASAEYDVQATIYAPSNDSMAIAGRMDTSTRTYYYTYYQGGGTQWRLLKYVSGSQTELSTYSGDAPSTARTVKLEIRDAAKKVFIGGVERISSADNAITAAGYSGVIGDGYAAGAYADDFTTADTSSGTDITPSQGNLALSTTAPTVTVPPQIGTPTVGTLAYSTSGGTSVAPSYPSGISADDTLVLIVGQKPSSANGGTCTTPANWTLQAQRTGATDGNTGGYSTTLGADTGNTNIYLYTKDSVTGSETGTLSVTVGTNNVCWGAIVLIPKTGTASWSYAADTGKDTTGGNVSIASSGTMDVTAMDMMLGAMVIPTDVTTPTQFSAEAMTQTSTTFGTMGELAEPDSTTGNDIGGFIFYRPVTAGGNTATVTMSATAGGTTTNVRGPGVIFRARLLSSYSISPSQGNLALSGTSPTVSRTTNADITPSQGNLALSGTAPTVSQGIYRDVPQGNLVITTTVPTVDRTANISLTPSQGNLALSGTAPTVDRTAHQWVYPAQANLSLSTFAPEIQAGGNIGKSPAAADLTLSATAPTASVTASYSIIPDSANIVISTTAPDVTTSGEVSVTATTRAGGGPARVRRRVIIEGNHYLVDKQEEAHLLKSYIEVIESEKKEVQKELVQARKINKAIQQEKPTPYESLGDVSRIDLSPIIREIKVLEKKRKDALRQYEKLKAELEDEEDAITLLLSMGL